MAKLSVDNHAKAEVTDNGLFSSYCKLYRHMSGIANFTIDSVCVYSKLYSVSDLTQKRLVRLKLLTILKTCDEVFHGPQSYRFLPRDLWGT